MIIDHPYIRSAKIVTRTDDSMQAVNTLVLESTVELDQPFYETHDPHTHELMDLLTQLKSFAEYDFADFQAVEVYSPQKRCYAHHLGHTGRAVAYS